MLSSDSFWPTLVLPHKSLHSLACPFLLGILSNQISYQWQSSVASPYLDKTIIPYLWKQLVTCSCYGWRERWWAPENRGLVSVVFKSPRPTILFGITVSLKTVTGSMRCVLTYLDCYKHWTKPNKIKTCWIHKSNMAMNIPPHQSRGIGLQDA